MSAIPSVDLNDFVSGDLDRKQKFIKEIGSAFENIGFVALKSHFLTDELVAKLYREIKLFFDLPQEIKDQYEIPGLAGQRGYTSFGKEHAKGRKEGDLKEFWHFGQYEAAPKNSGDHYPENIHVKELSHFNDIGKEVYIALEKTAKEVLKALALHIGLEEHYFEQYATAGNSILRPIHYPL